MLQLWQFRTDIPRQSDKYGMPPPVLHLKDIALTFGGKPLLTDAELQLPQNGRIALVGRNGSGKSTLLKIAAGMIEPDHGERFVHPGATLRYLEQEPDVSAFATILDYVEAGLTAGDDPHNARFVLQSLGLSGDENPQTLSGGEIRRAALARTLGAEPDILLLDEPTNHLDLPAIEWLENQLRASRSAIVVISHDRRFLENVSRQTIWVDRGITRNLDQGFAAFEEWRDRTLEEEEVAAHKLGRKIAREEHWLTHGVSGRRKRNMRRLKELGDLRRKFANREKPAGTIDISTAESGSSGKLVAKLTNVSKTFDERRVVRNFDLILRRGERVGIVGPNGAGKSTLIGLITGNLKPNSGQVRLGVNLETLTIDQKRQMLKPEWTLAEALTDGSGDQVVIGEAQKHVMSYMQDFLFLPEQAGTHVTRLSGGERGRLMLARGLRTPCNFLVLDEPTNDLDLETLDYLQEFISDFEGTVLLVSHDRDFLDRICTSVIASDGDGQWKRYAGGYSDMAAQRGSSEKARKSTTESDRSATPNKGRNDAPKSPARDKLSFKQKHALEMLPKEIERLEVEIRKLKQALSDPRLYQSSPEKFSKFTDALAHRESALAEKEEEWFELESLRESLESQE